MNKRRDFLITAGALTGAAAVGGAFSPINAMPADDASPTNAGGHKLPPLPYSYDALEPYIDAKTVEIHHDRHHAGYVNGLNKAEIALEKARQEDDYSLIQHWERKLAFTGAGAFLHDLYWKSMTPKAKAMPSGKLLKDINASFGSFEKFKDQFSAAAKSVEGSGWGLLVQRPSDNQLLVLQVENHQNLSTWDVVPLLCCDVWEHAYYLKYQNKRGDYISNWWKLINWDFVSENLSAHE